MVPSADLKPCRFELFNEKCVGRSRRELGMNNQRFVVRKGDRLITDGLRESLIADLHEA